MHKSLKEWKRTGKLIYQYLKDILPCVNQELETWRTYAQQHMHGSLQQQALASIEDKRFHCQGGAFYALYEGVAPEAFVRFVVALQTISDYLDNLCDRAGVREESAFAQLHLAMTDALDPRGTTHAYYAQYPQQDDGGYLDALVSTCRHFLAALPAYRHAREDALELGALYSQLQTYKHLDSDKREAAMLAWLAKHNRTGRLSDWEYAAATGSTLGIFCLAALSCDTRLTPHMVRTAKQAYFPWISGLHIQLDYLIDQTEDLESGDLNFIAYYPSETRTAERLRVFYREAMRNAAMTPQPLFTALIVRGLIALYLSDPKATHAPVRPVAAQLLRDAGFEAQCLYRACRLLRARGVL